MTVQQLIDILKTADPNSKVFVEDEWGPYESPTHVVGEPGRVSLGLYCDSEEDFWKYQKERYGEKMTLLGYDWRKKA